MKHVMGHRNAALQMALHVVGVVALWVGFCADTISAQQVNGHQHFNAVDVFRELDAASAEASAPLTAAWWDHHVAGSLRDQPPLRANLHTLLFLALEHSNNIEIARRDPLIRQTAIAEADSNFDWVQFFETAWNDTNQPIGNSLTAGGTATRLLDNVFQGTGGLRQQNRQGGLLEVSQQVGWQDNNSTFLTPTNQATSQLTLSYTHPLLRGRGKAFNNSIVVLANIDSRVAHQEFLAVLQEELLEVTRSYWALYRERSLLAHQMRLFLETRKIYETLAARQHFDTQGTQLISAASALENRRSDLIRARTAVTNAETRLRGLVNADQLGNSDEAELIPSQPPVLHFMQVDLATEIQAALTHRPEVIAAIEQVKAGAKRLGVARHELMPALNLVTQTFVNGLQGDSEFGQALLSQFADGGPSYSIGVQYEYAYGNRRARSQVARRQHELAQLRTEYERALDAVKTEVDIAVRELNTAFQEAAAKRRALEASEAEANTIEQRWRRMADGSGTSALNLESLLQAQQRVTDAEREYVESVLTYNLAMVSLKRATGTLLQEEQINVWSGCEEDCYQVSLYKDAPLEYSHPDPQPQQTAPPASPHGSTVAPRNRSSIAPVPIETDKDEGDDVEAQFSDYFQQ